MEIEVTKVNEIISEDNYFIAQKNLSLEEFEKNAKEFTQTAFDIVKEKYKTNGLAIYQYNITDLTEMEVSFFSNIINLPYSYSKKYVEFFADGAVTSLNFYYSVASPYVNKSKLWIEEVHNIEQDVEKIKELLVQANKNEKELVVDEKTSKK